jgi:hypothetical protein
MAAEALLVLWACWRSFGLAADADKLCGFCFLLLLYFAAFSILSARERRWFWSTLPSGPVLGSIAAELGIGTALTFSKLPGLRPLPWSQVGILFGAALAACLLVNDPLKVALIRWWGLDRGPTVGQSRL